VERAVGFLKKIVFEQFRMINLTVTCNKREELVDLDYINDASEFPVFSDLASIVDGTFVDVTYIFKNHVNVRSFDVKVDVSQGKEEDSESHR